MSFQSATRVTSGFEKLGIKQLEHDRKGKKVEKRPNCHQAGQVIGEGEGSYLLHFEQKREKEEEK